MQRVCRDVPARIDVPIEVDGVCVVHLICLAKSRVINSAVLWFNESPVLNIVPILTNEEGVVGMRRTNPCISRSGQDDSISECFIRGYSKVSRVVVALIEPCRSRIGTPRTMEPAIRHLAADKLLDSSGNNCPYLCRPAIRPRDCRRLPREQASMDSIQDKKLVHLRENICDIED